jgi:SAM-dependent methyltransferase
MYRLEDTYWWFGVRRRLVRALLQRGRVAAGVKVLDAGCGTGGAYRVLGERWAVVGLDVSPAALEFCRRRGMTLLVAGDVQRLPLRSASVEAAISCDVLEHLPDDEAALRELGRVVKPGGLLVLTVPALPWLWSEHDEALGHLRRYSKQRLRELLQRAGWEIVWLNYTVSLLLLAIVAFRLWRRLTRGRQAARVDLFELPRPVNALLAGICTLDSWLTMRLPMPPGASLVAVARRPAAEGRQETGRRRRT